MTKATLAYLLLWILGLSYGTWRIQDLNNNGSDFFTKSSKLDVLLIQPNFSLQNLASNPELSYSKRKYNLDELLMDSIKGLRKLPKNTNSTKLLVWPESVFPDPFLKNSESRQIVLDFAKNHKIQILFTTVDWEKTQNNYDDCDSFAQLNLITLAEAKFEITFSDDEITSINRKKSCSQGKHSHNSYIEFISSTWFL